MQMLYLCECKHQELNPQPFCLIGVYFKVCSVWPFWLLKQVALSVFLSCLSINFELPYSSLLCLSLPNDPIFYPTWQLTQPGPVITPNGSQEWTIDRILDELPHGHSQQYLIWWLGWGPEENWWLPGWELADVEALDIWLNCDEM